MSEEGPIPLPEPAETPEQSQADDEFGKRWRDAFLKPRPRRDVLRKGAGIAAAATGLDLLLSSDQQGGSGSQETKPIEVPIAERYKFMLGGESEVSLKDKFGIEWVPDVHVSYITLPDENIRRFFLTGDGGFTYILEGKASDNVVTAIKNYPNERLPIAWGPLSFEPPQYAYSGISSIIQVEGAKNPGHLVGFTHNERHAGDNPTATYTASISQIESFDGGENWQIVGEKPIIEGDDWMEPGTDVSGAGQPCAIVKDGFVYLYYIDWARKRVHHKDQIYLVRAPIGPEGTLGKFAFYKGNNTFGTGEVDLAPVITPPDRKSAYTALPSVSYNKALKRYLAVTESDNGFDITTSKDGINWEKEELFDEFATPHSQLGSGGTFVSYPTLVSFTESSDGATDSSGYLLYAKGSPHNLAARPFVITKK